MCQKSAGRRRRNGQAMNPLEHARKQAEKLHVAGSSNGWKFSEMMQDDVLRARLERGDEIIEIEWIAGKVLTAPTYVFAGRATNLRNLSDCIRRSSMAPDFRRAANRARREARLQRPARPVQRMAGPGSDSSLATSLPSSETGEFTRALPWDPEELDDRTLLKQCYCKTLLWRNSITGEVQEDTVLRGVNFNAQLYKVKYSSTGRRIIMFVGFEGFRAVGVEALLQVR